MWGHVYLVHEIETQQLDVLLDTVGLEVEPVVLVGEDEFVLSSDVLMICPMREKMTPTLMGSIPTKE